MARTRGARDARHEERRRELLDRMRDRLGEYGAPRASLRDLAVAAGVSLSTLAHYFGRRDDVIRAIMEDERRIGTEQFVGMAVASGPFAESVLNAVRFLVTGLTQYGLSQMIATNLIESLRHPGLGPVFLDTWLEPIVQSVEVHLTVHIERGEMQGDARIAALDLVAPVLLAALHQQELGGSTIRPLALDAFAEEHARRFVRGWRA